MVTDAVAPCFIVVRMPVELFEALRSFAFQCPFFAVEHNAEVFVVGWRR